MGREIAMYDGLQPNTSHPMSLTKFARPKLEGSAIQFTIGFESCSLTKEELKDMTSKLKDSGMLEWGYKLVCGSIVLRSPWHRSDRAILGHVCTGKNKRKSF